jgi:hypothetical protein
MLFEFGQALLLLQGYLQKFYACTVFVCLFCCFELGMENKLTNDLWDKSHAEISWWACVDASKEATKIMQELLFPMSRFARLCEVDADALGCKPSPRLR